MQDQILQVDENMLETRLDRLVSEKVEQLLNAMLDAEADEITGAARYERTGDRKAYRAGHYERDLTVKAGTVTLRVPKLKGALFESAVIERYRRREQSVEEALIDMYLAGVSTRQVDDISRLLWGERMPSQTLSDKLRGGCTHRSTNGATGRWSVRTRTCSWTACGTTRPYLRPYGSELLQLCSRSASHNGEQLS